MQRTEIIHAEQMRLLYANAPARFVATGLNVVLLALIQWPVIAPPPRDLAGGNAGAHGTARGGGLALSAPRASAAGRTWVGAPSLAWGPSELDSDGAALACGCFLSPRSRIRCFWRLSSGA